MKVLIITPDSKLGGAERNIALLARSMPRDRVTYALATTFGTGDLVRIFREEGLRAEEFRYAESPGRAFALRRYVEDFAPDLIHSWLLRGNWIASMLNTFGPRRPWIAAERGLDITRPPWKAALNRRMLAGADRVLAVSEPVRRILLERDQLAPSQVEVLPGGVPDAPPPLPLPDHVPNLARPRLVGVGHLRPEKHQALTLHALARVRASGSAATLTLFGDGPERPALERLAADLGIAGAVHFAGNVLDARRMLGAFDLLVLPSKEEGFPNVMLEAWQAGIPVLSTPTGGALEIAGPEPAAEFADAESFPDRLASLLDSPDRLADLAARGRARVGDFSIGAVVDRLLGIYEKTIGKHGRA